MGSAMEGRYKRGLTGRFSKGTGAGPAGRPIARRRRRCSPSRAC